MELKAGADNLVTNDGTISAYGTANTYGIHYGENTSGGVITNTGSITTTGGGSGDASVYVHGNGDGTVVNNSGTMSSTVYGVYLDSARSKGHTLNNQAGAQFRPTRRWRLMATAIPSPTREDDRRKRRPPYQRQ